MKRINHVDTVLEQANRALDPLTGRILDQRPGFDPRLLPDPMTPIAPWVEQTIVATVNEAIAQELPLHAALERLTSALERGGILVSVEELAWMLGGQSAATSVRVG